MKRNRIEYKEYVGTVEWYDDLKIFKGKVLGIKTNITYKGESIDELKEDFHKEIDKYIENCRKNNNTQDIPYKGSFNIRTTYELYSLAIERCQKDNISISKLVNNALVKYLKIK